MSTLISLHSNENTFSILPPDRLHALPLRVWTPTHGQHVNILQMTQEYSHMGKRSSRQSQGKVDYKGKGVFSLSYQAGTGPLRPSCSDLGMRKYTMKSLISLLTHKGSC